MRGPGQQAQWFADFAIRPIFAWAGVCAIQMMQIIQRRFDGLAIFGGDPGCQDTLGPRSRPIDQPNQFQFPDPIGRDVSIGHNFDKTADIADQGAPCNLCGFVYTGQ